MLINARLCDILRGGRLVLTPYGEYWWDEKNIMLLRLKKWYFDVISSNALGFYYIAYLSIGTMKIGASGIYHYNRSSVLRSFKFSRLREESENKLILTNSGMRNFPDGSELRIGHRLCKIRGRWTPEASPITLGDKPIFHDRGFLCCWKVLTPYSRVSMKYVDREGSQTLQGTGYIDEVQLEIPLWYMPFKSLYWGRLHSAGSWIVLFYLKTANGDISYYVDPEGAVKIEAVEACRDSDCRIGAFLWTIGEKRGELRTEIVRELENQEILRRGVLAQILPRQWLMLSGRDRKYEIRLRNGTDEYHGIMEEALWDA
jgi:hypothetical protein